MTKKVSELFADLLEESFKRKHYEGTVIKGTILSLDKEHAFIDVGLKSEGKIPLREFGNVHELELKVSDVVDVYLERMENRDGEIVLSREKARREETWGTLEESHVKKERVNGVITGRVRGGFTVDLAGVNAFLPGSQIDIRPIKDVSSLMFIQQPFIILKMDRLRGNIVVSRRAILEETQAEALSEIMSTLVEGAILEGVVKNITDYGAFIDLGGVDGLLHVTDIAWDRINHPSDVLKVGQVVKVKITKINDNNRISLGIKQLEQDPWLGTADRYTSGTEVSGTVSNIMEYGVFLLLEPGIEGLIHASELSWTKKNLHPSKILSLGETLKVKILEVDASKRRISLSLRQCSQNPWESFLHSHPSGSVIEGTIKNFTEFGVFVEVDNGIDGLIHVNDLSWDKTPEEILSTLQKGEKIKVKVLDVISEKERISLGIKQLSSDPMDNMESVKPGDVLTCVVQEVTDKGIQVTTDNGGISTFIRKADLAKDRSEQKSERFAVGERVDAQVVSFDKKSRKFVLSIKAREAFEEKKAMEEYGSSDSGASLGDILGAAIDLKASQKKSAISKEVDVDETSSAKTKKTAKATASGDKKTKAPKASKKDATEAQ